MGLGLATHQCTNTSGHQAFLVAQHGPSVNPTAGHQCEHTSHTTTVLENNAIPVAILAIHNGALSHMGETTKGTLQNDFLFIRATDVVGTIANLTTITSWNAPYLRDHQQIVMTFVFQHATSLQDASLVGLALEQLMMRTLNDIR